MVRYASIPICKRRFHCIHCGRRFASWPQIFQHARASHRSIPNYSESLVAVSSEPKRHLRSEEVLATEDYKLTPLGIEAPERVTGQARR